MPSYSLRHADNGTIYVHWVEGRRSRRVSTRTRNMDEARSFLATWLNLEASSATQVVATCDELWAVYWERHFSKKPDGRSKDSVLFSWKNARAYFGPLLVSEVSQAVVDDYVAKRRAGKIAAGKLDAAGVKASDTSIGRELALLRASWRWCAKRKIHITLADVPFFTIPDAAPPRERWLTPDEIGRITAAAEAMRVERGATRLSRLERFLALVLATGSRKQALLDLEWPQVDFTAGVIHLNKAGRRQTTKRRPSVPMSAALRAVLERAYAERETNYVVDRPTAIDKALDAACARAGVEGVSAHTFRHTAATLLIRGGAPVALVAMLLGDSIKTIEENYLKHSPDHLRETVASLDALRPLLGASLGAAPLLGAE